MATVVGPVNSTANYSDNDYSGDWSSGFLFAANQPILVEITYGVPGAPSDIIHDLPCPAGQSIDLVAPASQRYPNVYVTRVRFRSQGSQPASVTGYFGEARAPGIIANLSNTGVGGTALLNLANFAVGGGSTFLGLPTFRLPIQFGGFWLGTAGQTSAVDVLVQTQSGTTPIGGIVTGDIYGFSGGNSGLYAVPSIGETVSLTVRSVAQNINLAVVPILVWPPPQFDPPQQNTVLSTGTVSIGGGGVDLYLLPPYDGDCIMTFANNGANSMAFTAGLLDWQANGLGTLFSLGVAAGAQLPLQTIKLPHRIVRVAVFGTAGQSYAATIVQTPRRGGA